MVLHDLADPLAQRALRSHDVRVRLALRHRLSAKRDLRSRRSQYRDLSAVQCLLLRGTHLAGSRNPGQNFH